MFFFVINLDLLKKIKINEIKKTVKKNKLFIGKAMLIIIVKNNNNFMLNVFTIIYKNTLYRKKYNYCRYK